MNDPFNLFIACRGCKDGHTPTDAVEIGDGLTLAAWRLKCGSVTHDEVRVIETSKLSDADRRSVGR